MRKRLLLSCVFGLVGLAAAIPVGDRFGLSTVAAFIGCAATGAFLGYLVGVLADVFLSSGNTAEPAEPEELN